MGQILPRPTAEPVGWLQTGHHLPVSFQLPALFILLRSHRLPSGINRVAVLRSHVIKMPRPPEERRSFIPWASSFHALPPICCMLRAQTANDQGPHGDPGHSILISLTKGWFMSQKCTYHSLFFKLNTIPLLWASFLAFSLNHRFSSQQRWVWWRLQFFGANSSGYIYFWGGCDLICLRWWRMIHFQTPCSVS